MRRTGPLVRPMNRGARRRFEAWIGTAPTAAALLRVLEYREWQDRGYSPRFAACGPLAILRLLAPPDIARVRAAAVGAIEAAGGRVELESTVVAVVAGELRVYMK